MKYAVFAALLALPVMAGAKTAPAAPAATATGPKVGATVVGKDNQVAGTIAQVTEQAIVIDTGTNKVPVPVAAVGTNPKGFWIGMTKAELDAAYAQAATQAQASFAAMLTPGKMVHGLNGAMLGTVKAADPQFVTITTDKGDAKLPRNGFAPGADGVITVGLTKEQLDAAMGGTATTPTTPQQ